MRAAGFLLLCLLASCAHAAPPSVPRDALAAESLYRDGLARAEQGDLTRAEQYLASAHRMRGDRRSLVALLGVCVRASRLRSALAYAEPYLRDHPDEVPLLGLVAALRLGLGELELAERALAALLARDEKSAEAHYMLARVLLARASPGRARRSFGRYLALAPDGAHAEEARAALRPAR